MIFFSKKMTKFFFRNSTDFFFFTQNVLKCQKKKLSQTWGGVRLAYISTGGPRANEGMTTTLQYTRQLHGPRQ